MNPQRIFLGWDAPALPRAADALVARFGREDFDGIGIALPGARAARRLEELLLDRCATSWIPPRIATIGPITDALVRFPRPRAGGLARELAWMHAQSHAGSSKNAAEAPHTVFPRPEPGDFAGWAALAAQLRELHQELAGERKRFADVAACPILPAAERERWRALAAVQETYAALIERCGLGDPHLERLRALETNAPLRAPRALVLVGLPAVNGLQRALLERAAAQGVEIVALIAAPESEAAAFDEFGLARTDAWKDRPVPLDDSRWRVADRPADQAAEAAAFLAAACGGAPDARASVAVLQEEVAPFLARRLAERGSGLRPPVGRAVSETAPGRLLDALRAFVEGRNPRAFAALLRHPDLETQCGGECGAACDEYLAEHLPARVDGTWPHFEEGQTPWHVARLRDALRALQQHGGALLEREELPLDAWPREVGRLLNAVYAERLGREDAEAIDKIGAALDEVQALPPPLAADRLDAAEFLRLLMHACGREELAPDPARGGLERLGWLELPLDEAPALCVTGFQLGAVPATVHGHPFLPESLRVALGLPSNDDRRARDVGALHVLVHARERVLFVSGQRGTAGDPWLPSPLVFQGADAAARVRAFFRAPEARAATTGGATTAWAPPAPPPPEPRSVDLFSASQLNLYRKSPRLYWLQRELGLVTVEAEPHEMDALQFGNFTHELLHLFHQDEQCARLRGAEAIGGAVRKIMRDLAAQRFGKRPLAAVRLQLSQLEGRLLAWAQAEAESRAEGWVTIQTEWSPEPAPMEDFRLRGRMDRVDRRGTGDAMEIRVLDYKSGDQPSLAGNAFGKKTKRWEDLQLPIYRRMAHACFPEAKQVSIGWFNLPRAAEDAGIELAEWDPEAFTLADAAILEAVQGIRASDFSALGRPRRDQLAPALLALLGEAPLLAEERDAEEDEGGES